jgi:hypothetical protein
MIFNLARRISNQRRHRADRRILQARKEKGKRSRESRMSGLSTQK